MSSRRPERVSSLLLEAVAGVLLREVKDPRVGGVTLTGASVTPDLKSAKVFFTTHRIEDQTAAEVGLRSATGYIKRRVGGQLRLRHTPELHFVYDATLDNAGRLENLLREVGSEEP
jgi:ribosome-binding factor A